MLHSAPPASFSLQTRLSRPELQAGRRNSHNPPAAPAADSNNMADEDHSDDEKGGRSKSRRELPAGAVATLKAWLLSPEHFTHPYPTPQDQAMLMQKTGIDKKQLKNWFTNARRRIWKPMLKKQIEQGKLTTTGVAVPGGVPGLMMTAAQPNMENPHSVQAVRTHYQQAAAQQPQVTVDAYGNQVYIQQPPHHQQPPEHLHYYQQQQQQQPSVDSPVGAPSPIAMRPSSSIGSLPPMSGGGGVPNTSSGGQLNKTDSHAVLMELFARDQDLVRQATESARMKAAAKAQNPSDMQPQQQQSGGVSSQHPMKTPSQMRMSVPSLNSWPHFSSVSSLNNLGTMPGVKSITTMSGVDLANQGNVNKMGNLAQVKSMESMGKNDSYAFLEVFFGDRSLNSMANLAGANKGGGSDAGGAKGKRDRDDDNDVGLSLDDDQGPSAPSLKPDNMNEQPPQQQPQQHSPGKEDSGTLKRAYDDAMAARGLMSVSRSSEKLTDLALPAKIQRTLSQEFMRQSNHPQTQSTQVFGQYSSYSTDEGNNSSNNSQQYPGQHPGEPGQFSYNMSDPSETNASVEVPAATKCALCQRTNVDTQLRPCGHFYHEACLKPSLQTPAGPPRCPVDHIEMQSALLAVPTENAQLPDPSSQSKSWNAPAPAVESSGNSSG